jgi:hypothetical protein
MMTETVSKEVYYTAHATGKDGKSYVFYANHNDWAIYWEPETPTSMKRAHVRFKTASEARQLPTVCVHEAKLASIDMATFKIVRHTLTTTDETEVISR